MSTGVSKRVVVQYDEMRCLRESCERRTYRVVVLEGAGVTRQGPVCLTCQDDYKIVMSFSGSMPFWFAKKQE